MGTSSVALARRLTGSNLLLLFLFIEAVIWNSASPELYRLRVVWREAGGLAKLAWVVLAEYWGEITSTKC